MGINGALARVLTAASRTTYAASMVASKYGGRLANWFHVKAIEQYDAEVNRLRARIEGG